MLRVLLQRRGPAARGSRTASEADEIGAPVAAAQRRRRRSASAGSTPPAAAGSSRSRATRAPTSSWRSPASRPATSRRTRDGDGWPASTSRGRDVPIRDGRHDRRRDLPRRRAHLLPLVQVPPPARPLLRRRRLPELPRRPSTARSTCARASAAARDGPEGDAPERVAVRRPRRARRHRPDALGAAGRLLLQGRHQAEVRVAAGRADDPQDGGPRRRRPARRARATWSASTGIPTCSSSAPAWPASRRRSPRPATAQSVLVIDELGARRARRARARTKDRIAALVAEVAADDRHHDLVEHARHRPLRGPAR